MRDLPDDLLEILKSRLQAGTRGYRGSIEVDHIPDLETGEIVTTEYLCSTIDRDLSLRMTAAEAKVSFPWSSSYGWGIESVFRTNTRCRIYQWFGDVANRTKTFTGLIDRPGFSRDFPMVDIKLRDMMAIAIDQHVVIASPQKAGETGAVRTAANGVYLSMEVSAIVDDILDRIGWPTADRLVVPTSFVVEEYILQDGWSYAEAIVGDDRLAGLVGYEAFADEEGVFHFEPALATSSLTEEPTGDYIFRTGEDITTLEEEVDQDDLRTRVRVRGPLTTTVLTDEWREIWRTSKFAKPVGLWHDPTDAANLRVLDRGTKRLYKLRQSDRVVLSSVDISGIVAHPLGLSGDPSDSSVYWILNAPWIDGGSGGNRAKKVRKSDNHVLLAFDLPDGQISALKVSGSWLYFTRLDTDRFYRRSKTDGSAVASYQHTYNATVQANPSGMMIDGTTLYLFWANGGSTARFLLAEESAPGTVTDLVKTSGTNLHGGEMDTVTHTHCYGDSDSLGLVAKYSLLHAVDRTAQVFAEVVDTDLEDELGMLAQIEDREHDTHPGDADHPFEVRRDTLSIPVVLSIAQATETAARRLELRSRRRDVVNAGIVGNPGIQKTDVIGIVDPVTSINQLYSLDTLRDSMGADSSYLGVVALVPIPDLPAEVPDVDPPATEDPFPSVVQHDEDRIGVAAGTVDVHLPSPAGTGDLLVAWAITRSGECADPAGFTEIADSPVGPALIASSTPNAGYLHVWTATAAGGEQDFTISLIGSPPAGQLAAGVFEMSPGTTIFDTVALDNQAATTHPVISGLTAPGGGQVVLSFFLVTIPLGPSYSFYTPDGTFSEIFDLLVHTAGLNGPQAVVTEAVEASGGTSYSPGVTSDNGLSVKWAGIAISLS